MGMDVYGKNPTSETGEYFRASVWNWRPLADYVMQVAPDVTAKCGSWHTNDGEGLNAEDSVKLADVLQTEIDNGNAALYVEERNRYLDNLPLDVCRYCENGVTTQAIADKFPAYQKYVGNTCIQCKGNGQVESFETMYPLDVDRIQRFTNFLRDSGGFEIN